MRMVRTRRAAIITATTVLSATLVMAQPSAAQVYRNARATIDSGTTLAVRTNESIDVRAADGLVFLGTVDQDVLDTNGEVAIPRGSSAELLVRRSSDDEMILDLDSVTVNGQRYAVLADSNTVGTSGGIKAGAETIGANRKTAEYIGGGAILGTIVGAIAGGGKGAAIGAAVGAAAGAGAQIATQGRSVRVPAESVVTFRLARDLSVGVADSGFRRNGRHYHRDYGN